MTEFLSNEKVVAILMLLLGAFITHLLWFRRWRLMKEHKEKEREIMISVANKARFLNDLQNEYTNFLLAINEIWQHVWIDRGTYQSYRDVEFIDNQVRNTQRALQVMTNASPEPISHSANETFNFVLNAKKHRDDLPDSVEQLYNAHISDLQILIRQHLSGEAVSPPSDEESNVKRVMDHLQQAHSEFVEGLTDDLRDIMNERLR